MTNHAIRFFGGPPLAVVVRLILLSILVGVVLHAGAVPLMAEGARYFLKKGIASVVFSPAVGGDGSQDAQTLTALRQQTLRIAEAGLAQNPEDVGMRLPDMQQDRLAGACRDIQLRAEECFLLAARLAFPDVRDEEIEPDLPDRYRVRALGQQPLQVDEIVFAMPGHIAGMQARHRQQARHFIMRADRIQSRPMLRDITRHNHRVDARRHRTSRNRLPVGVKLLDIEMAVGIDQHVCLGARRQCSRVSRNWMSG